MIFIHCQSPCEALFFFLSRRLRRRPSSPAHRLCAPDSPSARSDSAAADDEAANHAAADDAVMPQQTPTQTTQPAQQTPTQTTQPAQQTPMQPAQTTPQTAPQQPLQTPQPRRRRRKNRRLGALSVCAAKATATHIVPTASQQLLSYGIVSL